MTAHTKKVNQEKIQKDNQEIENHPYYLPLLNFYKNENKRNFRGLAKNAVIERLVYEKLDCLQKCPNISSLSCWCIQETLIRRSSQGEDVEKEKTTNRFFSVHMKKGITQNNHFDLGFGNFGEKSRGLGDLTVAESLPEELSEFKDVFSDMILFWEKHSRVAKRIFDKKFSTELSPFSSSHPLLALDQYSKNYPEREALVSRFFLKKSVQKKIENKEKPRGKKM